MGGMQAGSLKMTISPGDFAFGVRARAQAAAQKSFVRRLPKRLAVDVVRHVLA